MGNPFSTAAKNIPPALKILWRPMLAIAFGLHALLLFAPLGEQKKAPPKADPKAVKITRLPKSPSNLNQPRPSARRAKPAVKRKTAAPPPTIVTKATPTPPPAEGPATPKGDTSAKPTGGDGPKVDDVTEIFTEPFAEFVVPREQVGGGEVLEPLRAPADAPVTADLFPNPNAFFSNPAKLTKRAGLVAFEWFAAINPDFLYNNHLEPIYTKKGFTIVEKGEYGGGKVYELKKGSNVRYFNIIPTGDKTGTLIMVWKDSPV
jgi:hypothetical protein